MFPSLSLSDFLKTGTQFSQFTTPTLNRFAIIQAGIEHLEKKPERSVSKAFCCLTTLSATNTPLKYVALRSRGREASKFARSHPLLLLKSSPRGPVKQSSSCSTRVSQYHHTASEMETSPRAISRAGTIPYRLLTSW